MPSQNGKAPDSNSSQLVRDNAEAIGQCAEANEIILLNSHDGTSSYQMLAGQFRLC